MVISFLKFKEFLLTDYRLYILDEGIKKITLNIYFAKKMTLMTLFVKTTRRFFVQCQIVYSENSTFGQQQVDKQKSRHMHLKISLNESSRFIYKSCCY